MISERKYLKLRVLAAYLLCSFALVSCGGGDDEADGSSGSNGDSGYGLGGVLFCAAMVLTSGDDACVEAAMSGSSSSGGGFSGGGTTGGGGASSGPPQPGPQDHSYLMHGNEYEPNNTLMNANIPRFAVRSDPNDQTGWIVSGAANDQADLRDAFALTPRRAYRYRIALCPPGERACENQVGLDPLTLFWRLLDQDGNEITSSQGAWSNKTHVELYAGLVYYVVVDAGDTMGATVDYKLYVYEQR